MVKAVFGLSFLSYSEVEDAFVEDIPELPLRTRCEYVADYILCTYLTQCSTFPPNLWAERPTGQRRTNNGPNNSIHILINRL